MRAVPVSATPANVEVATAARRPSAFVGHFKSHKHRASKSIGALRGGHRVSLAVCRQAEWSASARRLRFVVAILLGLCLCVLWRSAPVAAEGLDPRLGRVVLTLRVGGVIGSVTWSPDQRYLLISSSSLFNKGRKLMSFDLARRKVEWEAPCGYSCEQRIEYTLDGRFILMRPLSAISTDGRDSRQVLSVLDPATGKLLTTILNDSSDRKSTPTHADFAQAEDGKTLAVIIGFTGIARIYEVGTWQVIRQVGPMTDEQGQANAPSQLVYDSRRDLLMFGMGSQQGLLQSWNVAANTPVARFTTYKTGVKRMILNGSSGNVITGGDGALYPETPLPGQPLRLIGVQDDPQTLVRAWDPISGRHVRDYVGPGNAVKSLSLTPDGRYLSSVKARSLSDQLDAHVVVWETATGRLISSSSFGQQFVDLVSFSRDGKKLAVAASGVIRIIELDPRVFP